jgi:hypothetical protein
MGQSMKIAKHRGHPIRRFDFTPPNEKNSKSQTFESFSHETVTLAVASERCHPKGSIGLWNCRFGASGVSMPEAPMDENCPTHRVIDLVWRAGKVGILESMMHSLSSARSSYQ